MSVKIHRLWPVPVLIFSLYCLYTLVVDSYEVLYLKGNETDPLQFFVCEMLSDLFPGKTEINLTKLGGELYNHFKNSKKYKKHRKNFSRKFELILNLTKVGGYLILNRRVCLISKDQTELGEILSFLSSRSVFFAIKSDTFDFVRMEHSSDGIEQKIVLKKEHPFDCDPSNGKFLCLNKCLKRHFKLSRYFYQANETGHILLNDSESNRTIQESERICFGQCKKENCKLVQLIPFDYNPNNYLKPKIFEAEPVLSAFDFWIQIVGLIFSFVGLFYDHFASTATKLTRKLTRSRVRRRKVKVGLFYLNLTIIILSLAYCGYLCVRVALDQQAEVKLQERERTRNLIYPKTVHLAICVKIDRNDYVEETIQWIVGKIKRTLDDVLEGIYVSDGGRSFRTDYQVHPKVLFTMSSFKYLEKCFPVSIQPNYQTIPSRPILTVRFKEDFFYYPQLFVVSEEENLNSKSFWYSNYAFQKRIVKRMKGRGGCVDYKAKYGNCTGRQNCVERRIARKFIERYNKTTFGYHDRLVIDRDWFSSSEWNTSKLMFPREIIYLNISEECKKELSEKECDETKFEETVAIGQPDDQTLEIDLQFDVVKSVEELPYSLRMALDLLGIQSIFFGFTLLQLFWILYQFTKPRWRLKRKTDKVVWFIVSLLASIGCSWTTVRMLDGIVNGELVPTEHYEEAKRVQMPAMVFCLRIDQKLVDRNHPLTGSYLEELTKEMNAESMFENFSYLNESNKWTPFDLRSVKRFFLLNMKCFRVNIDQIYDRNQFHFSDDTQVLKMNFNKMEEERLVHFMILSRETAEFSKISNLDYVKKETIFGDTYRYRYRITHESSLYEHEDRFGLFRRYFPPLLEGDVGDLRGQLLELQANELHRRTLSLPVEEEHFGLKVDEDHFEQLHSLQKKKNLNKWTNLNYRKIFVANHLRRSLKFESDFSFHLVFLRRVVHSTNEVNYATLTLAMLNLLSLWLEMGVLDLRPFLVRLHDDFLICLYLHLPILLLRKLIKVLLLCCRYLRKLEPHFYDLIDPLKKGNDEEEEDSPDHSSTSDQPSVASVIRVTPANSST